MQQAAQTPRTPELDHLRPRVLAALRNCGWTAIEPAQVDNRFTVRAKRVYHRNETGSCRVSLAILTFIESGQSVTYRAEGHGGIDAIDDLFTEKVLGVSL